MSFIWATRGRTWGFRFLATERPDQDPLARYEEAFAGVRDVPATIRRRTGMLAVRFPDPDGRQDRSGRPIPHEFVLTPPLSDSVRSVEDAVTQVWPLVRERYAEVWEQPKAPGSVSDM
ncbi:hypothetical protein E9228_001463 [Curtobacterium flaccumfaciens]|uniref:Uncharacterized protein n=1 Tax=Curtobacterium salicis TaxID=1779862 RepID=A0ABX0T6Z8_9MICO|nr:hypothetical protein [Curtobacterium sp. WW7]NII40827.1 hypothetical protein [Curtobacterium sp. WW7]